MCKDDLACAFLDCKLKKKKHKQDENKNLKEYSVELGRGKSWTVIFIVFEVLDIHLFLLTNQKAIYALLQMSFQVDRSVSLTLQDLVIKKNVFSYWHVIKHEYSRLSLIPSFFQNVSFKFMP